VRWSLFAPAQPLLPSRLRWLVALRVLFTTLLVGLTGFFYLKSGFRVGSYSNWILLAVLVVGFTTAVVTWLMARRSERVPLLGYAEILLDQAAWTALIYVTGGATSGAIALYGLTCVAGAIVIGSRGAMVAALVGALLYVLLCVGFVLGLVEPPPDQAPSSYIVEWGQAVYPIFINLLVLMVVALLSQYLAERLRQTRGHLEEATARAEQAERLAALGRIAAGLAHEVRNPLGSILGSIQLLSGADGLGPDGRQLCAIIERETARLNDLVGDMLDLARPKKPVIAEVDLARTVRDVVALASQSGRGGDVRVVYDGPPDNSTVLARADGGQLRQVVWNLVRNAVQASSPGAEVRVRVHDVGKAHEHGFVLEVHDEGPGIDTEATKRLFDPFFTTRSAGVGIGLAVVKRIVDDHGWRIDIESSKGRGATFRVSSRSVL
jgi:two-component system, NtrC family, sensor histidine kinase HydH